MNAIVFPSGENIGLRCVSSNLKGSTAASPLPSTPMVWIAQVSPSPTKRLQRPNTSFEPSGEKLGRFSSKRASENTKCALLPSASIIQISGLPSGGGISLKAICFPSADHDGQLAELSGPRCVNCFTSLPSGFIVKISPACTNAMRPLLPGNVANAGKAANVTSRKERAKIQT